MNHLWHATWHSHTIYQGNDTSTWGTSTKTNVWALSLCYLLFHISYLRVMATHKSEAKTKNLNIKATILMVHAYNGNWISKFDGWETKLKNRRLQIPGKPNKSTTGEHGQNVTATFKYILQVMLRIKRGLQSSYFWHIDH